MQNVDGPDAESHAVIGRDAIIADQSALTSRSVAEHSSAWRYTPGSRGLHPCKMNGALQRVDVLDFLALCFPFEHWTAHLRDVLQAHCHDPPERGVALLRKDWPRVRDQAV